MPAGPAPTMITFEEACETSLKVKLIFCLAVKGSSINAFTCKLIHGWRPLASIELFIM
jgi:hypothetical protein